MAYERILICKEGLKDEGLLEFLSLSGAIRPNMRVLCFLGGGKLEQGFEAIVVNCKLTDKIKQEETRSNVNANNQFFKFRKDK